MKELNSSENGSTYLIEFNVAKTEILFKTMYDLLLFPENDPAVVEELAKLQDWEINKSFYIKLNPEKKFKLPFPVPIIMRDALTKYCDLSGLVSYVNESL